MFGSHQTSPEAGRRGKPGEERGRTAKPFVFSKSRGRLNWKLLHGVDLGRVVHGRDLAALERGIEAVLHGDINMEDPVHMSTSNYVQLVRLCQLAVDYLEHEVAWLRNLTVALQEKHASLRGYFEALEQLRLCLESETQALLSHEAAGEDTAMRNQTGRLAAARAVQAEKSQLAAATEQCEDAELNYRSFHFLTNRRPLDWRLLHSVDVDAIVSTGEIGQLVAVEDNVAYGNLQEEDPETLSEANFRQLSRLAQCIVEVLCFYRLIYAGEKGRWEEECKAAAAAAMEEYSRCREQERELKEASGAGGEDAAQHPGPSAAGGTPHGRAPRAAGVHPSTPGPSAHPGTGKSPMRTPTSAPHGVSPVLAGSPAIAKSSPGSAEVHRSLDNLKLKMREECAHQEHMQSKLGDLQRTIDRIKLRNLQRILEEQRIREEEAMFAQEEVRRTIETVKYRAMDEQQRTGDTTRNLFRFVQTPDRFLATPGSPM